jgi:aminocarboxymuconate-semialdehyde decarboxylase
VTIIDTQSHWFSRTLLDSYLDFDAYPRCIRDGDDYRFEVAPDRWMPIGPSFHDLDHQLATYDAAGVDVIVSSSASFGDVDRHELGRALELAAAVNEERAAAQRAHPGRFYGLATLPWQDADAALATLDEAILQLGLRGVLIHSNIDGAPIDSEACRAVYRRIAELGVPLFVHPALTIAEDRLRDWGLEYLVGFMFDSTIAGVRLVVGEICAELPELRVVVPHCGGTLPFLAGRIDNAHSRPFSLGRTLDPLPSEQLRRFYTDTVVRSAEAIAFAQGFFAEGHMMFGSDYPFFPVDTELAFVRSALAERDHDAVLGANAARLLGLT